MTNDEVFAQALQVVAGLGALNLALPNPYKVLAHQSGLGRECVMVRLWENDVTPYATYELAGEDPEGRRYCVRSEYCFTQLQAIKSIGRRTGTNLEVGKPVTMHMDYEWSRRQLEKPDEGDEL